MKYGNQKTVFNGITFDSRHEAERYKILLMLERAGRIEGLRLQVPFELQPSFRWNGKTIRSIKYVADFVYKQDGRLIVEDAKGVRTKEYLIKKKMMLYKGIEIKEV